MQHASSGADLRIAVAGDVVHQEVDEAAFFLKQGKKIDDLGVGLLCRRRRGGGADRFGGGPGGRRLRPREEEGDENEKGEPRDRLRQDGMSHLCVRRQRSVRRQLQSGQR